jgi:hypothetical protein
LEPEAETTVPAGPEAGVSASVGGALWDEVVLDVFDVDSLVVVVVVVTTTEAIVNESSFRLLLSFVSAI